MTSVLYAMYQSFMWIFGKFKYVITNVVCLEFITWYHILKWNVLLHFKYCYGNIDMSAHITKCLFTGKSYNMVWFFLQGRVVLAPLFYVNFADFWLADQLNSLVVVFIDFQYLICFYLTSDSWMSANGKKPTLIASSYLVMCVCVCMYIYIHTHKYKVSVHYLSANLFDRYKCLWWLYSCNTSIGWLPASLVEICTVFAALQRYKRSLSSPCECWEICHIIPCYAV